MSHRRDADTNASVDCYVEVTGRQDDRYALALQQHLTVQMLQHTQGALPHLLKEIGKQQNSPTIGTLAYHTVLDFEAKDLRMRVTTTVNAFRSVSPVDLQSVVSAFEQSLILAFVELLEKHHEKDTSSEKEASPTEDEGTLLGWLEGLELPEDSPGRRLMTPLVKLLDKFLDEDPDKGKSSGWPSDI